MARNETLGRRSVLRLWTLLVGLLPTVSFAGVAVASESTLTITGTSHHVSTYEVTVSDQISPMDAPGQLPVGPAAEGALGQGVHRYRFSGELTNVRLAGEPTVRVDGRRVDPASLGGGPTDGA